ncbi:MAG TPA: ABC transporter ATP-binding protein [Candidatus Alectryocaccobium stercorigallinarum]|nr:ABC transporter ATP-binding protein [Candidatus Alectryocaccobium stercorigallinarum]
MAYIQIKNLSAGYGKTAVVSGMDLDIEKGKILAFIGPNGSGKSTILKSISKNIPILGGDIIIDGKSIKNYSYKELSKKMAVILTERVKTELMTCRDVVEMGRFPYTGRLGLLSESDEIKVKNALEAVNALDIAEKDFNKISDGQRQRILLARAICQEPEIIVLDEPTSFLDIKYKFEVLTILMRMAKEKGITVVMSLHETELAKKSADVIAAVSRDGSVRSESPEEMFDEKEIQKLYGIDKKFLDPVFWQDL